MKAVLSLALVAAVTASPIVIDANIAERDAAPILSASNAKAIPNSYMIKFKDHITTDLAAAHHGWVENLHVSTENRKTELRKRSQTPFSDELYEGLKHTYNIAGSFLGYSGHFDEDVIEEIRRHPDVSEHSIPLHFPY